MIKHNPRLSLKDRYRLVKRVLKLALDKDSKYVNLMWQTPEEDIHTHTFYVEGMKPVEPFLAYMASVAGKSKTLEAMNERAQYYLNKTAVAFTKLHRLPLDDFYYVANPIRKKSESTVGKEVPLKQLYEDNVLLINKFNGTLYLLDMHDDTSSINLCSDDVIVESFDPSTTITYLGSDVWILDDNKYYVKSKQPYYPS